MNKFFRYTCATTAAISSLLSGLFWKLSANAAVDALAITGHPVQLAKLTMISLAENQWAAYAATVAGVALAIGLLFEY